MVQKLILKWLDSLFRFIFIFYLFNYIYYKHLTFFTFLNIYKHAYINFIHRDCVCVCV